MAGTYDPEKLIARARREIAEEARRKTIDDAHERRVWEMFKALCSGTHARTVLTARVTPDDLMRDAVMLVETFEAWERGR
jgi:hypothetical protein